MIFDCLLPEFPPAERRGNSVAGKIATPSPWPSPPKKGARGDLKSILWLSAACPMALVLAVRREPSGGCSSRFLRQTDAGQLALLRFNDNANAIGCSPLRGGRSLC